MPTPPSEVGVTEASPRRDGPRRREGGRSRECGSGRRFGRPCLSSSGGRWRAPPQDLAPVAASRPVAVASSGLIPPPLSIRTTRPVGTGLLNARKFYPAGFPLSIHATPVGYCKRIVEEGAMATHDRRCHLFPLLSNRGKIHCIRGSAPGPAPFLLFVQEKGGKEKDAPGAQSALRGARRDGNSLRRSTPSRKPRAPLRAGLQGVCRPMAEERRQNLMLAFS